jgi:hypothetical protein
MIRRRPRGETTLSKATYDHKQSRFDRRSPAQEQAELEQDMRDAAYLKQLRTDPAGWVRDHILTKKL